MQSSSPSEPEQQSKEKFISLMNNLINLIDEDPSHQLTIYECLNTEEIKRLFESLHDHVKALRITALVFITKLLNNCPQIVDTLLMRDNCDLLPKKNANQPQKPHKFLISSLSNYRLNPNEMMEVIKTINGKVRYRKCLFWYVEIDTKNVGYIGPSDISEGKEIDPKFCLISIFVGDGEKDKEKERTIGVSASTSLIRKNGYGDKKYTISKAGQFSIQRKG